MKMRNESLDALRGLAILAMVLSGTIAYGDVMPAWMYHAQVPPPLHQFNPALPGLTWVDLVFPFFLFSMGAAIPLSMQKYVLAKSSFLAVAGVAFKRCALLAFFALFTEHMKAWVIAETPVTTDHLLSVLAFILLFFQFYEYKKEAGKKIMVMVKAGAFVAAIILLAFLPFHGGAGFSFYKSDIIIMVLANMAFFGMLIYYLTLRKPLLRLGILPFILAVFLAAREPGDGWTKALFNFNHIGSFQFDWLYKFYFLKYLFIIIPATYAGEWILQSTQQSHTSTSASPGNIKAGTWLAIVAVCLVATNLYGLFTRHLFNNFIVTLTLCSFLLYLVKTNKISSLLLQRFTKAGIYLLLLGLFFEAYEGGIKKDVSTYSYYFVTAGLAYLMLVFLTVFAGRRYFSGVVNYLALNGKNPMVAYVAGSLLLLPLLSVTHTKSYWDGLQQNAWIGLLKGVLFTGVVSLVTLFFVKKKWFWKT